MNRRVTVVPQDISRLQPMAEPDDADAVEIEWCQGNKVLGRTAMPAIGALTVSELTAFAIRAISLRAYLSETSLPWRPRFWFHTAIAVCRLVRREMPPHRLRRSLSARKLREIGGTALRQAAIAVAEPRSTSSGRDDPASVDRRVHWEWAYRQPDPWDYGSPYEQLKYRRTLALVPDQPIRSALELACSEGRFTELLAHRVERLTATDISDAALGRARARCRSLGNVEFHRLDFLGDVLPSDQDLIVCSEALYYCGNFAQLARVGRDLARALRAGGRLLVAHANLHVDDPSRSGFDWESPFGAQGISAILSGTPGLALERSLQTELYRIDLFRQVGKQETKPEPVIEVVDLGPAPDGSAR